MHQPYEIRRSGSLHNLIQRLVEADVPTVPDHMDVEREFLLNVTREWLLAGIINNDNLKAFLIYHGEIKLDEALQSENALVDNGNADSKHSF